MDYDFPFGNFIIPTDELHQYFRGVGSTTNQLLFVQLLAGFDFHHTLILFLATNNFQRHVWPSFTFANWYSSGIPQDAGYFLCWHDVKTC